jgi:Na+/H+ antiporter NhaD/arsenite permease-like protein
VRWRRRRVERFDIVTPTEREARDDEIAKRRRWYFIMMIPCIALVLFGFFVPAPVPLRLAALAVAAVLPPLAAIVGNAPRR